MIKGNAKEYSGLYCQISRGRPQTPAIKKAFHPRTYRIDQIRSRLQKRAEGQPHLHSHRWVRR
jgi:hypothetical protein